MDHFIGDKITIMYKNANRLLRLIDQLMDFRKIVHVHLPDLGDNLRIQIYSLTGQLMSENLIDAQNAQTKLNVGTLPNGIYFLTIKRNSGTQTKKFIVSR